jgi:hypothetical protein
MRAAEGLVDLKSEMVPVFTQVVKIHDRYGLHAFLAALENANLRNRLDAELRQAEDFETEHEREKLLAVLLTGKLAERQAAMAPQPIETAAR